MASSSRNKSFRTGSKKIIYNVIKFCDQKAEKGELIVPIAHSAKRASQIAGVYSSTIKKIRREARYEHNPFFGLLNKELKRMFLKKKAYVNSIAEFI